MTPEPKPALLLVPGVLDDAQLWAHQTRALADMAAPVVADVTRHDTVADMARAVLAAAPPEFALAGFSLGGYVAFEIMRQAPERVTKLALLGTSARADTEARRAERRAQMALVVRPGGFEAHLDAELPIAVHSSRLGDAALMAALRAMARRQGQEVFVRQNEACLARPDSRPGLAAIRCPALVLCGREDAILQAELSEEIARAIVGATLALVDECGHYLALERPEETTARLRAWLRS